MGKHDLQFRKSFKDPELFRQACEIYLPDEIKSQLKLETLKLRQLSGSFIRNLIIMEYGIDPEKDPKTFEQLKAEIADIVYTCERIDGGETILIGHFEHVRHEVALLKTMKMARLRLNLCYHWIGALLATVGYQAILKA